MHSPRFDIRKSKFSSLFSKNSIENIWKKKVRLDLNSLDLKDPIENLDFHLGIEDEARKVSSLILSGNYKPKPPMRLLAEKSKGLCRQLIVPDRVDAIVLQRLSDAVYPELKANEPCKSAFFERKDFSFIKSNSEADNGYGTFSSWLRFQKTAFGFAKDHKFVVITDIANYYDTISLEHLKSTIALYINGDMSTLDMLIFCLKSFLWQPDYSAYVPVGLPQMNVDAPRILAHCFLYELDQIVASRRSIEYTRFMDDIDFGCSSILDARLTLRDIDLILQTKQVRLNSGKTKILTQKEAFIHFKITENENLDRYQRVIKKRISLKKSLTPIKNSLDKLLAKWDTEGRFDNGNGDKILKRLLSIYSLNAFELENSFLIKVYRLRPSCREAAIRCLFTKNINQYKIDAISQVFIENEMVDDLAPLCVTNILIDAKVTKKLNLQPLIFAWVNTKKSSYIHSSIRLASKYFNESQLLDLLETTKFLWKNNEFLGRAVGASYPFFSTRIGIKRFATLIGDERNLGVMKVVTFQNQINKGPKNYIKVIKNLEAPNNSKPNKINHSKFISLLSVLSNKEILPMQLSKLLRIYKGLSNDFYYKQIIGRKFRNNKTVRSSL